MAINLKSISIKDSSDWYTYLDLIYPIGTIYMSTSDNSPASVLGGSWAKIEGKFLIGANNDYSLGSNGGNANHTHEYGIQYSEYYGAVVHPIRTHNYYQTDPSAWDYWNEPVKTTNRIVSKPNQITSATNTNIYRYNNYAETNWTDSTPPIKQYIFITELLNSWERGVC